MYLLDTNVCIQLWQRNHQTIRQRFLEQSPHTLCICSVVKAELLYGARHSQKVEHNLQLLKAFFAPLQSLPFDDRSAEEYGQIRADLVAQGKIIGPNDLMIAAIARAHDVTLITNNTDEFSRIVGLRMEDWENTR